jgi:hypothetical protein
MLIRLRCVPWGSQKMTTCLLKTEKANGHRQPSETELSYIQRLKELNRPGANGFAEHREGWIDHHLRLARVHESLASAHRIKAEKLEKGEIS